MPLTPSDRRYHAALPEIIDYLCGVIQPSWRVLEIGPGLVPFRRADVFVDILDRPDIKPDALVKLDVCSDPLPFEDKSFDFIYCRHVLEDLWNPFHLCAEMSRVGKMGYIETPSPIAEMCRGVDGDGTKDSIYRGYHHHRWFVWRRGDELVFIPKFPLVESIKADEEWIDSALRAGPQYWNTYHPWMDEIAVRHLQNPLDYEFKQGAPTTILDVLNAAINESRFATDCFLRAEKAA